jgi:UDP-N-acetylmuramate: L-alanyl-gamma-D-glutamyl-meso-diaminopimelate ligase
MATLAAMLKRKGRDVRGSDQDVYPPMSDFLAGEGIPVLSGYRAEHITSDIDFVVVGNAISRGNPELEEVLDRKIRYGSLPEAIRDHFLWGARSIVIAGTHGKTTTTSLTGWVLTSGGVDPSVLVGGVAANFGDHGSSYRLGGGRDFVIEGDEYDSAFFDKTAKFLKYLPDICVVNNIEFDHADITRILRRWPRDSGLANLVPRRGLLLAGRTSGRASADGIRRLARRDIRPERRSRLAGPRHHARECPNRIQGQTARIAIRAVRGAARRSAQRTKCACGDRGGDRSGDLA